jgi:hypothetical protein
MTSDLDVLTEELSKDPEFRKEYEKLISMDDKVDAIIRVKVPKWQIGEEVSIYFPDTMTIRGKCEIMPAQVTILCENADAKTCDELKAEMQKAMLAVIDNAPTVNPCENCDLYFKAMTKEEMRNDNGRS